jgi:uncharacterized protein (TIGR02186 family)
VSGAWRHGCALLAALLAFWIVLAPTGATAQEVVADLSKRLIAITTGFSGTDVLLFGAVEGKGDVVVIVRGPLGRATVRRKSEVAGIWINQARVQFENVPSYYAVSATAPLAQIVPAAVARRTEIGARYLNIRPVSGLAVTPNSPTCSEAINKSEGSAAGGPSIATIAAFCEALLRNERASGLYPPDERVTFLPGRKLFRTTIRFPANVPVGQYTVQVFVIRDGQIVASQTHPLFISKIGIEAEVFDFAHRQAAVYGAIAVVVAVLAGWGAGQIFRRS